MIKPGELENREGTEPANGRPAAPSTRPRGGRPGPESHETEAQQALLERIEKAKSLEPQGAELHCRDCWNKGRNAAIRVIEGEGAP